MANPFSMGLPNQALKAKQSQFQSNPLETIPVEFNAAAAVLGPATTALLTVVVAPNKKVTLDSFLVTTSVITDIFTLSRNGTTILSYTPGVTGQSVQVFAHGVGKEFDENDTWVVSVTSVAGSNVVISVSGRDQLKRQMLYSPLIA
jgi:hypothetical protein